MGPGDTSGRASRRVVAGTERDAYGVAAPGGLRMDLREDEWRPM
jgi:hypothetical protein